MTGTPASSWEALVTASMLGADRRPPPAVRPDAVADVIADAVLPDDAARMLAAVAALAAARRAAFVPGPAAATLQTPPADERPTISSAAAASWHQVVADWPVLEDEWMLAVIEGGWRLSADVLAAALARHRVDPVRRVRVALAGGPLAAWVVEHVPALAAGGARTASAEAVAALPELAIGPEFHPLLTADTASIVARLVGGVSSGEFGLAHRPVLVNLLARCRPDALAAGADALVACGTGVALALADLARLRHRMLGELSVLG